MIVPPQGQHQEAGFRCRRSRCAGGVALAAAFGLPLQGHPWPRSLRAGAAACVGEQGGVLVYGMVFISVLYISYHYIYYLEYSFRIEYILLEYNIT